MRQNEDHSIAGGIPFVDINPVIGAMDYPDWMNANYPGKAFPAA